MTEVIVQSLKHNNLIALSVKIRVISVMSGQVLIFVGSMQSAVRLLVRF